MIDLKKIVDDWNALCDAGDKLAEGFSKLDYEQIKKFYSDSDLENWENGNQVLKVDNLKDFILMSAKTNQGSLSYTEAVEKFFKNYKQREIKDVSYAYNYWGKMILYLLPKAKNEKILFDLKEKIELSKSLNATDAFYIRNNINDVKDFNVAHNAALGMIELGLQNLKEAKNNFLLKLKSNISKEEWLSVLIDLSEQKYIHSNLSNHKKYVTTWLESAFEYEEARTFDSSSFERLEWKKPVIALAEFLSKLIAEKIIVASIEDAQEINKVIQWMRSFFVFKSNDKSLMTYFKDARNGKLKSYCFKLSRDNSGFQFEISY